VMVNRQDRECHDACTEVTEADPSAAGATSGDDRPGPDQMARQSCPLPRVWPFLLTLKEPLLVGLRPGRVLEPH
jgi:hypothetical protein